MLYKHGQVWHLIVFHTHTHPSCFTQTCKHRQTGSSIVPLLFIHFRNTSHMFCTRLANGGLFLTGDPIVPFVISPRFECLNKLTHYSHITHTHTQTCKHWQTGSSHCSSFVYTFSQHLSYVLYTFGKRGPFSNNEDPIVPFVISPRFECLNKRTHPPTLPSTCKFFPLNTLIYINKLRGRLCHK